MPAPVPEPLTVSHDAVLTGVQAHPELVVTVTEADVARAVSLALVGFTA